MTHMKSRRRLVVSLACVAICGCASAGVGTPLPEGGASTFLIYAPPDSDRALRIYGISGYQIFRPKPVYDNDPVRPANTPANYIAFTAYHHLEGGVKYEADMMQLSPLTNTYEFEDEVDPFYANSVILITPDD